MTRRADPFLPAVCALGITQITAWGTSYFNHRPSDLERGMSNFILKC